MSEDDSDNPLHLQTAAHELGHALVWDDEGLQVVEMTVDGEGGRTRVMGNDGLMRGYCIGCLAGYEAERLWAREHGGTGPDPAGSATDFATFARLVQDLDEPLTATQAQSLAVAALVRNWRRIEALVPRLVRLGRLTNL